MGTGFVIAGQRIVTNAHVVMDVTVLQVVKQGDPTKFRGRVAAIAHDIDLAVVQIDDDVFWKTAPEASLSDGFPELYSEVKVVGFPAGGSTVCVTKGVVSRIDAHLYAHPNCVGNSAGSRNSPPASLILQIDAAINGGNSGGPAFDKFGAVIGVASSGVACQQNVGYIIP